MIGLFTVIAFISYLSLILIFFSALLDQNYNLNLIISDFSE